MPRPRPTRQTKASRVGGFARREQDWALQSNLAAGEINQTFKQLRAAQIREALARREWNNHKQQMKHAAEVELFPTDERNGKKSGLALYVWMKREARGLYGQRHQFAFDVAKKAQRALQHRDLWIAEASFVPKRIPRSVGRASRGMRFGRQGGGPREAKASGRN